jgi:hypothetical protein
MELHDLGKAQFLEFDESDASKPLPIPQIPARNIADRILSSYGKPFLHSAEFLRLLELKPYPVEPSLVSAALFLLVLEIVHRRGTKYDPE